MQRTPAPLVIDARPRGPRGPLAVEPVRGRPVLHHLLDLVSQDGAEPPASLTVLARVEDRAALEAAIDGHTLADRVCFAEGTDQAGPAALRTDRLYDGPRLRKALRGGLDPESAVIWRLDTPHALAGAGDELERRRSYQPLGSYWALKPARALARALAPTRVRPNAVTLLAASLVLSSAATVAFAGPGLAARLWASVALAVALVLDTADGHLARLQGTASAFGRWLDGWLDEVGDMALHAAASWAAYTATGSVGWLLLETLYASGKFLYVAATQEAEGDNARSESPAEGPAEAAAARWVRLAGHADVRWHLWIALAAMGRLDAALAAYAVYFPARAVLVAVRKAVRHA